MAAKQLVFSEDARRALKRGIDVLSTAGVTTLGPKGLPPSFLNALVSGTTKWT